MDLITTAEAAKGQGLFSSFMALKMGQTHVIDADKIDAFIKRNGLKTKSI